MTYSTGTAFKNPPANTKYVSMFESGDALFALYRFDNALGFGIHKLDPFDGTVLESSGNITGSEQISGQMFTAFGSIWAYYSGSSGIETGTWRFDIDDLSSRVAIDTYPLFAYDLKPSVDAIYFTMVLGPVDMLKLDLATNALSEQPAPFPAPPRTQVNSKLWNFTEAHENASPTRTVPAQAWLQMEDPVTGFLGSLVEIPFTPDGANDLYYKTITFGTKGSRNIAAGDSALWLGISHDYWNGSLLAPVQYAQIYRYNTTSNTFTDYWPATYATAGAAGLNPSQLTTATANPVYLDPATGLVPFFIGDDGKIFRLYGSPTPPPTPPPLLGAGIFTDGASHL